MLEKEYKMICKKRLPKKSRTTVTICANTKTHTHKIYSSIECDNTVLPKICANKVYKPVPDGDNSFVIINVLKSFEPFVIAERKYLEFANVCYI